MKKFRIIPVLDILNSKAVHAMKGLRDQYKPLNSVLFHSTNPYRIVKSLRNKYGIEEIYIADLDSIIHRIPNFKIFSKISKLSHLKIMIDPGIISIEDLEMITSYGFNKIILGLETIRNLELIPKCFNKIDSHKIVVSIDMYNGKITTKIKQLNSLSIIEIVKNIEALGVKEIILLDLYRVGQKLGDIPSIYLDIRRNFKHNILVGGGIKELKDIIKYANFNFSGVLLGTALYDGTIKVESLKKFLNN